MTVQQKYLGSRGFLMMLALISAFPPLSTDLYLPALPQMMTVLGTTQSKVNMTLSLFFVFFACGLLFWGPLSEKYGRKPILLTGLLLYVAASILCAISQTVGQLITFRIIQAFGGSAATAVATAIIKDIYYGREREKVLSIVMTMVIIAPVIAPVLGAFLLKIASWRAVFGTLAGFGCVAIAVSTLLQETLEKKYEGSVIDSLGRLVVVLKNPGFSSLLWVFSMALVPMMAFLASSSYIYINNFGLSEQAFSYFFAMNAVFAMTGPFMYLKLSKRFPPTSIITLSFVTLGLSGVLVISFGYISPLAFGLAVVPATISITIMRPPGTNIMLEQQKQDNGPAASLISFCAMVMGSLGMVYISLDWTNQILALGLAQLFVGLFSGALWLFFRNKSFVKKVDQ